MNPVERLNAIVQLGRARAIPKDFLRWYRAIPDSANSFNPWDVSLDVMRDEYRIQSRSRQMDAIFMRSSCLVPPAGNHL